MKKNVLYGLSAVVLMFSGSAYANPVSDDNNTALTTKGYVDAGLKYVYDSIKGEVTDVEGDIVDLQTDVSTLQNKIGNSSMGTNDPTVTGAIGEIESRVDAVESDIDGLKTTVETLDGLGTDNLDANKKYILQTDSNGHGSWNEIKIESSWSDEAFEQNVLGSD